MKQARGAIGALGLKGLLAVAIFLATGQAAHAYWYPVYSDGEYMGCTHIVEPLEPGYDETVNMGEVGCWLLYLAGLNANDNPPLPVARPFKDAAEFSDLFGLTSDPLVQQATRETVVAMRKRAESLQAAALELMRAADAIEPVATTGDLERWVGERLQQ